MIPLAGQAAYCAGKQDIRIEAGVSAAYMPQTDVYMEGITRSVMMVEIDHKRLEGVTRTMLGLDQDAPLNMNLDRPQQLQLQHGRFSFEMVYHQLANMIDGFMTQQNLLNQSGIDDNFYRTTAMLMLPDLFLTQDVSVDTPRTRRLLDRACQYIQAHQDQAITLSELEHVSGMSERNLQIEFQKRYQCTPMQWIRSQRLASARERLLQAVPGTTVTAVALICGFNKPSTFAHYYKLRFGEQPSTTLARSTLG
jgi:AraC-like DNA-binding protein